MSRNVILAITLAIAVIAGGVFAWLFNWHALQWLAMSFSLFLFAGWLVDRFADESFPVLDRPYAGGLAALLLAVLVVAAFYLWAPYGSTGAIEGPGQGPAFRIRVPRVISICLVALPAMPFFVESLVRWSSRRT